MNHVLFYCLLVFAVPAEEVLAANVQSFVIQSESIMAYFQFLLVSAANATI